MSVFRVALVELKRLTSGVLPVLVLLAMSCIPLLYGSLYLYGNWDAYGNVNGIVGRARGGRRGRERCLR